MLSNTERRAARLLGLLLVACAAAFPAHADAVKVTWERLMLPVSVDGGTYRLETLLVYPSDGVRHPLAVISHGSPRNPDDRSRMSPGSFVPEMLWFAERGWAVAAMMRRGYGRSQGGWAETYGRCGNADYYDGGKNGAADIAASIAALGQNPHIDASRVLATGVSAGAFATVALTANPPPNLRAAVVFAPGRGSQADDDVCREDRLVDAMGKYGTTSRLPVLWISAANDHFFGPRLVNEMVAAFNGAGGKAVLFAAPAFGRDGHGLFTGPGGDTIWGPVVDRFLAAHGMALKEASAAVTAPAAPDPVPLSRLNHDYWLRYLEGPPHKAFAASADGYHAGVAVGRSDVEEAKVLALQSCKGDCKILSLEGVPVK